MCRYYCLSLSTFVNNSLPFQRYCYKNNNRTTPSVTTIFLDVLQTTTKITTRNNRTLTNISTTSKSASASASASASTSTRIVATCTKSSSTYHYHNQRNVCYRLLLRRQEKQIPQKEQQKDHQQRRVYHNHHHHSIHNNNTLSATAVSGAGILSKKTGLGTVGTNAIPLRRKLFTTCSSTRQSHQNEVVLPVIETQQQKQQQQQQQKQKQKQAQLQELPDHVNIIIIGGGIIGTSVAYHLGKAGYKDILLLEQNQVTSGTTWHAAGLMTSFGSLSSTSIALRLYTQELYKTILPMELSSSSIDRLEEENSNNSDTSNDVGYMPIGFIELACGSVDRLHYLRRVMEYNKYCGIPVYEISPVEVERHCPIIRTTTSTGTSTDTTTSSSSSSNKNKKEPLDVLAGFYSPNDGRVNPTDVTIALAKCARNNYGVTIREGVTVKGILTQPITTLTTNTNTNINTNTNSTLGSVLLPKRVTGVVVESTTTNNVNNNNDKDNEDTTKTITANIVVNCTGMWGRQFVDEGIFHNNGDTTTTTTINHNKHHHHHIFGHGGTSSSSSSRSTGVVPLQAAEHYYIITDDLPECYTNNNNNNNNSNNNSSSSSKWPVIEDPSKCMYIRPEGNGLLIGFFESIGAEWNPVRIPNSTMPYVEIEPNWERMIPYIENAFERFVPEIANTIGIKKLFCGPESFTPDNKPMVGPLSGVRNYYIAAGMNSVGILTGGGIGKVISEWISTNGITPPSIDVTPIYVNRFDPFHNTRQYRTERVRESLGNTYKLIYPDHQPSTGRNVKQTSIHTRLQEQGGYFRPVSGWESPLFYRKPSSLNSTTASTTSTAAAATSTTNNTIDGAMQQQQQQQQQQPNNHHYYNGDNNKFIVNSDTFGRPNWFHFWEQEHISCRNDVALFDMSFMSKFLLSGADAGRFLNYLSTANVMKPVDNSGTSGTITYTQWLNPLGYMEADLTVTKLDNNDEMSSYLVVASDTMHNHVLSYMKNALGTYMNQFNNVSIQDVTSTYVQLNIQGPQSRTFMEQLVTDGTTFSNDTFPFRSVRTIEIGYATCTCIRITYVGELGYELFIPTEHALYVYDQILHLSSGNASTSSTCTEFNLRHAGLKALGSLRMEKGYRDYGHDVDNTDTIFDVGLSFTCAFEKEGGFIGREHAIQQKNANKEQGGACRRMVNVLVPLQPTDPLLYHGEVIYRDGVAVGYIRSASYGHTVGGGVGLSVIESRNNEPITKSYIQNGNWEIQIADKRYPCQVSLQPWYDPSNERIKL